MELGHLPEILAAAELCDLFDVPAHGERGDEKFTRKSEKARTFQQ